MIFFLGFFSVQDSGDDPEERWGELKGGVLKVELVKTSTVDRKVFAFSFSRYFDVLVSIHPYCKGFGFKLGYADRAVSFTGKPETICLDLGVTNEATISIDINTGQCTITDLDACLPFCVYVKGTPHGGYINIA